MDEIDKAIRKKRLDFRRIDYRRIKPFDAISSWKVSWNRTNSEGGLLDVDVCIYSMMGPFKLLWSDPLWSGRVKRYLGD